MWNEKLVTEIRVRNLALTYGGTISDACRRPCVMMYYCATTETKLSSGGKKNNITVFFCATQSYSLMEICVTQGYAVQRGHLL